MSRAGRRLLAAFAADESPDVQQATARSFALLLARMPGLERTLLVSKWASSGRHDLELVVARALQYSIDVLGGDVAIEHLSKCDSADVRCAAAQAAWTRRSLDPQLFDPILERLMSDADPAVAETVRLAHVE